MWQTSGRLRVGLHVVGSSMAGETCTAAEGGWEQEDGWRPVWNYVMADIYFSLSPLLSLCLPPSLSLCLSLSLFMSPLSLSFPLAHSPSRTLSHTHSLSLSFPSFLYVALSLFPSQFLFFPPLSPSLSPSLSPPVSLSFSLSLPLSLFRFFSSYFDIAEHNWKNVKWSWNPNISFSEAIWVTRLMRVPFTFKQTPVP